MGAPLSVMLDRAALGGGFAATANGGNGTGTKCGQPKLMRSTDGVQWTTSAPAAQRPDHRRPRLGQTAGPRAAKLTSPSTEQARRTRSAGGVSARVTSVRVGTRCDRIRG